MRFLLRKLKGLFTGGAGKSRVTIAGEHRNLELTGAQGIEITFRSDVQEEVGGRFVMRVSIHHERLLQPDQMSVMVEVVTTMAVTGPDGNPRYECSAVLINPPEHVAYLLQRQFNDVDSEDDKRTHLPRGHEQRQAERRERTFQVMSPSLRGFKAIALDISATGIRVQVGEPKQKGDILPLSMDFDFYRLPVVQMEGEVMWCRPDGETKYQLGLRFIDPDPEKVSFIVQYLQFLAEVDKDMKSGRFPMR